MRRLLLVSDNEILNDLYTLNLEVYTGTEVVVQQDLQSAITFLENQGLPEVIVSLSMINGQETAVKLQEYLNNKVIIVPFIVLGTMPKNMVNVVNLPSTYNLQHFIRMVAKMLGVTAKEMAEKEVSPYYPIPTKSILGLLEANCNVYLQARKSESEVDYILILKKGSPVSNTLSKLFKDGINTLYVNANDRLLMVNLVSTKILGILKSSEAPVDKKVEALASGFELITSQLVSTQEISQEVISLSNACMKAMEEITKETPSLKGLLSMLANSKDGHVYVHSLLASYVAQHIVKNISWGGKEHVEKLNFVIFFHDIMLAPIYQKYPHLKYEEDILFDDKVSDKDKEIVLNHARLSAEMMSTFKRAPLGADLLIKQHHGMTSGIGFAMDYKDDISPLSKVVIIAESFVEELMRQKEEKADAIPDPKNLMSLLSAKYKKHTYKKIIETLANIKI